MTNWEKCVAFHGHECPGLTIGYKAALYAAALLDIDFSSGEEVVCIAENDACSVDAIQVLLGCSVGKGNLLFHMTGKQAYSIYDRSTGNAVRLVLKPMQKELPRAEAFAYYQSCDPKELFTVKKPKLELPETAKLFSSCACDCCGETTGSNWIRLQGDKKLCIDCYPEYDRFRV